MNRIKILLSLGAALFFALGSQPGNAVIADTGPNALGLVGGDALYQVGESGWHGYSYTSDGQSGWGDDQWQLTLGSQRAVSIHVLDCCIQGDNYEVWIGNSKIGTTPAKNLWAPTFSEGTFTTTLSAGSYLIRIRDAGGVWYAQHGAPYMIPAGYNVDITTDGVSGRLAVPNFKQGSYQLKGTDQLWGKDIVNNYDSAWMWNTGCAVTSVADLIAYYGSQVSDGYGPANPGTVNHWLTDKNGYAPDSAAIYWGRGAAASANAMTGGKLVGPDRTLLDKELAAGHPVILKVHNQWGGGHWLVATGKNGSTYWINDPAGTTDTLSAYPYYDNFYSMVLYGPGPSAKSWLSIVGRSPIEMIITDPRGNVTGFDPASGTSFDDIPMGSYAHTGEIGSEDGLGPDQPSVLLFEVSDPIDGQYTIQVIGTASGDYEIDITATDWAGNPASTTIHGTTAAGLVQTLALQYDWQIGSPIIELTAQPPTPTPTPPPGVGGTVKLPAGAIAAESGASAEGSGWGTATWAALAGVGAVVAIGVGGWYARRRWLR